MAENNSKLHGLQFLRALAALMVVVDHSVLNLIDNSGLGSVHHDWAAAFGDFGVKIFFGISGFIMAYTTSSKFDRRFSLNFLLRRIWRIVPLYWLISAIYLGRLWIGGDVPPAEEIIKSFLFIPYLDAEGNFRSVYGLGWTLNFEMYFYVLFAIALIVPRKIGLLLLSGWFLGTIVAGAVFSRYALQNDALVFMASPIIIYFLIGILACELTTRFRLTLGPLTSAVLALMLAAAGPLALTYASNLLGDMVSVLAVLCLILVVRGLDTAGGRPMLIAVALGDASYSIYLTHSFLLGPASKVWSMIGAPVVLSPVFVAIMLAAASVLGWVTFRFVEKPLLALLRPIFAREGKPALTAP